MAIARGHDVPDLWLAIFERFLPDARDESGNDLLHDVPGYYNGLYCLQAVCKAWRDLIVATPVLWRHVSGINPLWKLGLERSRTAPLTIYYDIEDITTVLVKGTMEVGQSWDIRKRGLTL